MLEGRRWPHDGLFAAVGADDGHADGHIDGNAVLRLAELHGVDGASRILNRESGLLGLGGVSDMRALHAAGTAGGAVRAGAFLPIGRCGMPASMVAAMGGLDGMAFTGGIGENDRAVRAAILDGLAWPEWCRIRRRRGGGCTLEGAAVTVWIVPAEEERRIAGEATALIAAGL